MQVAFLGTGLMGAPMVRNLLKAGYRVNVWNRTASKAQLLVEDGAECFGDAKQAVATADVVITMLTNGAAVEALLFDAGIAKAMKTGAILIDMGSIKPQEARRHGEALQDLGISHLDAPVSGGTRGAEAASLAIMVGGDAKVFEAAKPVLSAMGRAVLVGPAGSGQLAKLANQMIVAVTIGAVAEAMLLVEQGGADPLAVRAALKGGFADSVILQQHGERMTSGNFVPGGYSFIQLKDLNNGLEEAAKHGLNLPLTRQMQERYHRLTTELAGAELDHAAIWLELKDLNGL